MKKLQYSLLILLISETLSQDTFSIVAVDPQTQEVGSAGASCINGSIIISDVHPGIGAVHTQSYWNSTNQNNASNLMDQGYAPEEIIEYLVENDSQGNPSIRQYGVVDLVDDGRSAAFTGENCYDYKNHILGPTYSIQGNILLGQEVLDSMEVNFLNTSGSLATRLMAAMQGAKIPGADTRCLSSGISSLSAFIRVAQPNNLEDSLYLHLNVNNTQPGIDPIDTLQDLFDDWYAENPDLVTIQIDFNEGWNLVGLPAYIDDADYSSMFPEAITGTLFSFGSGYISESELIPGMGYWLRFSTDGSVVMTGIPIYDITLLMNEGWNLITGISTVTDVNNIQDPDGIIISGTFYDFDFGYGQVEELVPGHGYWVRTSSAGEIMINQ
ncbi:MAG: DUF1028 domain-containing protein [Candidatus Neomarinimicrobiota bacterium]|nr:DUF1028 domain-containing protein [Candidatus Neomarinimicrobiota bacterium]